MSVGRRRLLRNATCWLAWWCVTKATMYMLGGQPVALLGFRGFGRATAFRAVHPHSATKFRRKSASPSALQQDLNEDQPQYGLNNKIAKLEAEVAALTGGQVINCKSRKQVSLAVFGSEQPVNRKALKEAIGDSILAEDKRMIAELVLELRSLTGRRDTTDEAGSAARRGTENTGRTSSIERSSVVQSGQESVPSDIDRFVDLSSYEKHIDEMFSDNDNKIDVFWKDVLLRLSNPVAQKLVAQLRPHCPAGFPNPQDPTTFLGFYRKQKDNYKHCVILMRCGDFYETFGIDAILLVEFCGLNPMGGKAKAGCPKYNIQATLNDLTNANFRVVVFEEGSDTNVGNAKLSKLKNRFLSQMVTPAEPTYLYNFCMNENGAEILSSATLARPYVGVVSTQAGYTLVEVSMEERTVKISERMTSEAVACRLSTFPPVDPLFYVPSENEARRLSSSQTPSFVPVGVSYCATPLRIHRISPSLVQREGGGMMDTDRAKNVILQELLLETQMKDEDFNDGGKVGRKRISLKDFKSVESSDEKTMQPLYLETATQLGLTNDPAIPPIVANLMPATSPAATQRFLKRMLLVPPPPSVADSMRDIVHFFRTEHGPAVPPFSVPPIGKVLLMLHSGEASAQVFGELYRAMQSLIDFIDILTEDDTIGTSLMTFLAYETGMSTTTKTLRVGCHEAMRVIEAVVCLPHHESDDYIASSFENIVPSEFFTANERPWRGRVRREALEETYRHVEDKACRLAETSANDFWPRGFWSENFSETLNKSKERNSPVMYDIRNNDICLKEKPKGREKETEEDSDEPKYIAQIDRMNKVVSNRHTTRQIRNAVSDYKRACDKACKAVSIELSKLSKILNDDGHIPAIVQAAHANLILSTAFHHACKANSLGWGVADVYDYTSDSLSSAGHFKNLWPYWMKKSAVDTVTNTFELEGMFILTAPNMSGKSTLMRSAATATLLSVCGLCAPLEAGSRIRRCDHLFVRGASSDIPSEGKSAFGAEMSDVAAMLRSCGPESLVFVDELGRGTSPRDGTKLAGAVFEHMASSGISGIFATHLHDILKLPLKDDARKRIREKRMALHNASESGWTYKLEDGVCSDSMALVTARDFGIPFNILRRAQELEQYLPASEPCSSRRVLITVAENNMSTVRSIRDEARQQFNLQTAASLAESITGSRWTFIPERWNVHPSFSGKPAVYILELPSGCDGEAPFFYVGETGDARTRLQEHRNKRGPSLSAAVLIVGDKSKARDLETELIRAMAGRGFPMASTKDGIRLRP